MTSNLFDSDWNYVKLNNVGQFWPKTQLTNCEPLSENLSDISDLRS